MKRILLFLVVAVGLCTAAIAQTKPIKGKVTDEKGDPVPFATVKVKGAKGTQVTDAEGFFTISAQSGSKITVTSVGFEAKDYSIGQGMPMIVLSKASGDLSEVIVTTALGVRKNPKEFGGAATVLSNKTLTQGKAVGVAQALNGKVSGVNISTTNSGVFEDAKINIRGIRSLTGNNQPLLVIDGAPTPLSFLSSIPPDDIQDITILKSAVSASLYGPDGVNGVIVVTTKKGNKRPSVTFSTTYQFDRVAYFPKLQKQFGGGAGEVLDQYGNLGYVPYENQQFGPAFDGTIKDIGVTLEDGSIQRGVYSNAHYKDKVKFFNTGYTLQNSLSFSGEDFYLGIQDANIHGMTPNDQNRRTSLRFNGAKKYNNFSADYGLNYVLQNYNVFNDVGSSNLLAGTAFNGGILDQILQTANNIPLLSYKDWRNDKFAQFSNYYNEFGVNPYWEIDNLRNKGQQNYIQGNINLNYQLASWLKATAKVSTTVGFQNNSSTIGPVEVTDWAHANRDNTTYTNRPGAISSSQSTGSRINFDYYLSGDKEVGKDFKVKYLAGGTIRQDKAKDVSVGGANLVVPNLFNVSVRSGDATVPSYPFGNFDITSRLLSFYGSVGVGYKGWANIEFTGRNDWDSKLLKENQSFFYPGVSASLILSDAIEGLKSSTLISYLKLRGGVAKSGNVNLAAYQLQATYSQPAGFPYGNVVGFSANNTIPATDLKPEFNVTKEVGIEIGLLKNRINLEGTYFYQNNTNQILNVTQSAATGYSNALKNAADFNNYGVELDLGLTPLVNLGKKTYLDFKVNATYNNNKVTKTFDNAPVVIGGNSGFISQLRGSATANNVAVVGLPAFAFQLTDYERDSATGKVIVDSKTGYPSVAAGLVTKGRSLPTWILGFTPTFTTGDLTISMTWDFKGGHDFYAGEGGNADNSGISARSAEYGRQRFVFPNSVYKDDKGKFVNNTNIQVADGNYGFWTSNTYNLGIATNYFSSAAAWRLRELNISYSLPTRWLGNGKVIRKLTVSAVGRNLLLLVPKSNQWGDPEFNYTSTGNTYGISSSFQSPSSRFFGGTIAVQF
ncbi:SusC/RagA family TonB-linked outer membrane protein [Parasediminibacterium sp. JCM 36343]|uniref:SusC/RagA family TonB-linked outer membrane protein n=1 Tax=Parasediminibacterium sp. JCM 36343 TaxID=3374279 RepID=UPI00397BA40E